MANQRAKDQQLLPFAAKRQFVEELDAGIKKFGSSNRSQFIRDASLEKLAAEGVVIPRALAAAPDRTQNAAQLNDATSSEKINKAVAAGGKKISYSLRKPRKAFGV